jgi:hypothetical protein
MAFLSEWIIHYLYYEYEILIAEYIVMCMFHFYFETILWEFFVYR